MVLTFEIVVNNSTILHQVYDTLHYHMGLYVILIILYQQDGTLKSVLGNKMGVVPTFGSAKTSALFTLSVIIGFHYWYMLCWF